MEGLVHRVPRPCLRLHDSFYPNFPGDVAHYLVAHRVGFSVEKDKAPQWLREALERWEQEGS